MFFKKDNINEKNDELIKVGALLIHAAKIDEDYSQKEAEIIKQALLKIGANNNDIEEIIRKATEIEENANQILDFTKEIKNADEEYKKKIFESLWNIIYSDEKSDLYEANLMRRLSGLLYLDPKIAGNIKEKVKLKLSK